MELQTPERETISEPPSGWSRQGLLWRRVLAILAATALLAAVARTEALHGALVHLFQAAEEVVADHPVAGPVVFVALAAGSAMLAFVSSALLVPAGLMVWGAVPTLVLLWGGWILGGLAAYGIARFLGRPVALMLSSGHLLARWEERLSDRTPFGVVLLFQLAVPSEVPGYALGLVRYPLTRYLTVLALGELPYAVGTVYLGASFLARRTALLIGLGLVGAAAILVAFRALHRHLLVSSAGQGGARVRGRS